MTDKQSLSIVRCLGRRACAEPGPGASDVFGDSPAAPEGSPVRGPADPPGPDGGWKRVTATDLVPSQGMKAFLVDGVGVLIAHTGGDEYVAVQAQCPHEMVPLEDGLIQGLMLTCLEHMWQFDLESGAPLGEAEEGLRRYPLKNEGGHLYVVI
jgi:nitrite reductase/ring-hydroxylating ferredoxin subunit